MRWAQEGESALHPSPVGCTHGPHFPVRPSLLRYPLDRVVSIGGLVRVPIELSFGLETPPAILSHEVVPPLDEVLRLFHHPRLFLVVGRPLEDRGELALDDSAFPRRPVNIGCQPHPIAHIHHDILHYCEVVLNFRQENTNLRIGISVIILLPELPIGFDPSNF